jgi:DNA-binding GntR family transcriptional regulator
MAAQRTRATVRTGSARVAAELKFQFFTMQLPTSMLAANAASDPDSKHAEAYRYLRERIVSLELAPASLLDEQALAEAIGVGLTPVRQALRRLAWESLVVILPRRGTIVADLHPADIENIFEMRLELEALAAELAALRATPAELAALDGLIGRTRAELDGANDPDTLIALDRETHGALWEASGNAQLVRTLDWLYVHVLRLWNYALPRIEGIPALTADHLAIVDAVRAHDASAARQRMHDHVHGFQLAFRAAWSGVRGDHPRAAAGSGDH